jgi:divalent metal cation (Fe/Co/Zn/Cd) transporter
MVILLIVAACLLGWGAILTILNVGKPKEPTTPGVAALATLINAGIIFLLLYSATHI